MSQKSIQALIGSLRSLQSSEEYSDLMIFCGDRVFHVHKAVVCPRSAVFEKSCKWGNKSKSEITLEGDEPRLIQLMIDYLYRLDYDDSPHISQANTPSRLTPTEVENPQSPQSPVEEKIGLYEKLSRTEEPPAEAFTEAHPAEVAILREEIATVVEPAAEEAPVDNDTSWRSRTVKKSKKKRKTSLVWDEYPDEPAESRLVNQSNAIQRLYFDDSNDDLNNTELGINALMYALADKYGVEDLKEVARSKFAHAAKSERNWKSSAFPHAANIVCESTLDVNRGLRTVVIDTLDRNRELLDYEEVQELLSSANGLALALLQRTVREDPGRSRDFY